MSALPLVRHGYVRVPLAEGTADFHLRWLRNNCELDLHPKTRERIVSSADLPDVLDVREAAVREGALHVTWVHDGRVSRYPLSWLAEHAYARDRVDVVPTTDRASLHASLDDALKRVAENGAAILRGVGTVPESTERLIESFARLGLKVVGTHFGRIEDLRTDNTTNQNTDQLGYTDAAIDLHTDQPFLETPPRYQLLHCLNPALEGGESDLVDARAIARLLQELDLEAYRVLRTTRVTFHRKQAAFEKVLTAPILDGGLDDAFRVRFSYFTLAPHALPFGQMEGYYRAYDRFTRLARQYRLRFKLEAGEALLYDNHRMLHGRTGFRGARWVRGVYFNP